MTDKTASGVQIPDDLVQVGFVSGAYGVAGAIRVRPFSSEADALLAVKTWWLDKPAMHSAGARNAKLHGGDVVARLDDVADRDAAEALKGAAVFIPQSQFPVLDGEDEFYWADLIGLEVKNLQGEHLGKVADMMSNGPQSILRVQPAGAEANPEAEAQERLIPFVDAYIIKVDQAAKLITVDWGLDY